MRGVIEVRVAKLNGLLSVSPSSKRRVAKDIRFATLPPPLPIQMHSLLTLKFGDIDPFVLFR